MKKTRLALILVGILAIFTIAYVIYFNHYIKNRFKFYDERIFRTESRSAGLTEVLKHIITNDLVGAFAASKVYSKSSCNEVRSKFKEVYTAMRSVGGFKTWRDRDGSIFYTDNEFFLFSFKELRFKYSQSQEKFLVIEHVEQCLLNEYLQ